MNNFIILTFTNLGGGMRQSGILAAAANFALDNMIQRLADDHKHAKALATAINGIGQNRLVKFRLSILWHMFDK